MFLLNLLTSDTKFGEPATACVRDSDDTTQPTNSLFSKTTTICETMQTMRRDVKESFMFELGNPGQKPRLMRTTNLKSCLSLLTCLIYYMEKRRQRRLYAPVLLALMVSWQELNCDKFFVLVKIIYDNGGFSRIILRNLYTKF